MTLRVRLRDSGSILNHDACTHVRGLVGVLSPEEAFWTMVSSMRTAKRFAVVGVTQLSPQLSDPLPGRLYPLYVGLTRANI